MLSIVINYIKKSKVPSTYYYYFELKNNVQRSGSTDNVTDNSDPDTYSKVVKTLN